MHQSIAEILKSLGDENRLKILSHLSENELCVYEIMDKLDMSQSTVSHHLKILKNTELIKGRKAGKWVFYSINEDKAKDFHKILNDLFGQFSKAPYYREDLCEKCDNV